jgi:hypothetical protein
MIPLAFHGQMLPLTIVEASLLAQLLIEECGFLSGCFLNFS